MVFEQPVHITVHALFHSEEFFFIARVAQAGDVGLGEALVFAFERVGKFGVAD